LAGAHRAAILAGSLMIGFITSPIAGMIEWDWR
jgi:hypothetical protein